MQVHNLRDTDVHMATIRDWIVQGRIRYSGLTHYRAGALDSLEAAMKKHRPDFIQINYSLGEREADQRLLPLAADMGIAVLVNRPYQGGALFQAVSRTEVPDWASDFAASPVRHLQRLRCRQQSRCYRIEPGNRRLATWRRRQPY